MIFSKNIITIACNDDSIYEQTIDLEFPKTPGSSEYETRNIRLTKAIHEVMADVMNQSGSKMLNPINYFWQYTGEFYSMGKAQVTTENNCKIMKDHMR